MTTTIASDGVWRPAPIGGQFGTGITLRRDEPAPADGAGVATRLVGTRVGEMPDAAPYVIGGATLAGVGVAAGVGGAAIGSRLGAAGLGSKVGWALGAAAVAGAGFLMWRGAQLSTTEYQVTFADEPDLSGVAPGEVYAALRAHHERNAPAVERELEALVAEEKVRSFSGIIGANGFVVEVVNRHRDEVEQRLAAVEAVGRLEASPF